MNSENAKDFLPLIKALSEGKIIQRSTGCPDDPNCATWEDYSTKWNELGFGGNADNYRVKPEPRRWWILFSDQRGLVFCHEETARRCAPITPNTIIEVVEVVK